MELVCEVKNYEWGKMGNDSAVAKLAQLNKPNLEINNDAPYAELWMGDHPSGPSKLKDNDMLLSDFLEGNPELTNGKKRLSFLFKILSIRKALSIQVHPNKEEAERLHEERPDIYKDPNHKPELAIALTPFTAMVGFRPHSDILGILDRLPELTALVGSDNVSKLQRTGEPGLRATFGALMNAPQNKISECIKVIGEKHKDVLKFYEIDDIFEVVCKDFPDDVGILGLFFFNVIDLDPGQAIYLDANEPHAYLSGDCIECMACSDNVVRAGLTPKYKDVDTLLDLLNYTGTRIETKLFDAIIRDDYCDLFIPPVSDFAVHRIILPVDKQMYHFPVSQYGSIFIVLSGRRVLRCPRTSEEYILERGKIMFLPGSWGPLIEFKQVNNYEMSEEFVCYFAMYNEVDIRDMS